MCLAHSSSLIATKIPPSFPAVTHEGTSGTHGLMEELLTTFPHKEHLQLQVTEERFDMKGFGQAPILHYGSHELPLWENGLDTEEVVEHILSGRANIGVYASMDRVDRYMTDLESHKDIDSAYVIRVLYIIAHLGYPTAQVVTGAYNSIQEGTCRHEHT